MWKIGEKRDGQLEDALKTLIEELPRLKRAIEDMASDQRKIRLEWEDTLDRMTKIMGRLNKRAQREAEGEEAPNPQPEGDRVTAGPPDGLDPKSRAIIERRKRHGVPIRGGPVAG